MNDKLSFPTASQALEAQHIRDDCRFETSPVFLRAFLEASTSLIETRLSRQKSFAISKRQIRSFMTDIARQHRNTGGEHFKVWVAFDRTIRPYTRGNLSQEHRADYLVEVYCNRLHQHLMDSGYSVEIVSGIVHARMANSSHADWKRFMEHDRPRCHPSIRNTWNNLHSQLSREETIYLISREPLLPDTER